MARQFFQAYIFMNRFFYIFVVSFIQPFIVARLLLRSIKTPIYRKRIFERYAMQPPLAHASTVKKPIWIHAVSVGEVGAASGLVNEQIGRASCRERV